MQFKRLKAKWARKLMRSRYFVVLTDKESVIAMDGVNPESVMDVIALQAQGSALKEFAERLNDLIKLHDKRARKLTKEGDNAPKSGKSKARKIKVKEG